MTFTGWLKQWPKQNLVEQYITENLETFDLKNGESGFMYMCMPYYLTGPWKLLPVFLLTLPTPLKFNTW